ncbi:MAG TPA: NAD(P)/FAD-dependent oxidoreductase [Bryobacteraceae bacterium]|nr:NAD(P)/FAD-dependent oxidoreductase [Bryobacteraceae bacterium]
MDNRNSQVIVLGAGPAGLTAAYVLSKSGVPIQVLEADPLYVGGISRTVRYKGFHFDIGGHRFFSKSKEVEDLWTEILGNDLLQRPRSSRIFYNGRFFFYPLKALDALSKLGILESARCMLSYAWAKIHPTAEEKSFEDWVSNRFGKRLFRIFFKTYTEKVWGMSCKEISADWAAQRIKGLSLATAVKNALLPQRAAKDRGAVVKTLIDTFRYPRRGPGMMWERCADEVRRMGADVRLGRRVSLCRYDAEKEQWQITARTAAGETETFSGEHVISSMPIRDLANCLEPRMPEEALAAARSLRYRDFLTVGLILKDRNLFPDNWIYIHDPNVKVGRIQNYKSWSPEMVPDPAYCCYGLEYFCFEGDGLWSMPDERLIELAKTELEKVGLARAADVEDGCVIRQAKAYPVYDDNYAFHVETVRLALERHFPNLHPVGRNGMHKYNNQDHAMMTAMLTARNIIADNRQWDAWLVNQDAEYHEAGAAGAESVGGLRMVPSRVND